MKYLSWREVFCTSHNKWWGDLGAAADGAVAAGYNYLAFNGNVYNSHTYTLTGVTTDDLNGVTEEAF